MEKNTYIAPKISVIRISSDNLLQQFSFGDDEGNGTPEIKEFDELIEDDEE